MDGKQMHRSLRAGDGQGQGGGPFSSGKCPFLILSVISLDTPNPPLRSQDPLIPIGFLVFVRVERLGGKKAGPKKARSER